MECFFVKHLLNFYIFEKSGIYFSIQRMNTLALFSKSTIAFCDKHVLRIKFFSIHLISKYNYVTVKRCKTKMLTVNQSCYINLKTQLNKLSYA